MNFSFFEIMFLLPIMVVGSLCVFTDLKTQKIYNKVIAFGFFYGLVFFIYFSINQYNETYFSDVLINFLISVFVSYALWFYNCWSAGDAKLFSLFAFLLPLSFYEKLNYPFFPSFDILINLFIPVVVFLLILSILNIVKEKKIDIKKVLNFVAIFFKASFIYILIYLLLGKVFGQFSEPISLFFRLLYFFFIFFTVKMVGKFLNRHFFLNYFLIFSTIAYSLYLVFCGEDVFVQAVFLKVYLFLGTIFMIRMLINSYIDKCDVEVIKANGSKVETPDKTKKEKVNSKNIQKILSKGTFAREYNNFPFSIFIFIAVIITILIKGSLLIFLF